MLSQTATCMIFLILTGGKRELYRFFGGISNISPLSQSRRVCWVLYLCEGKSEKLQLTWTEESKLRLFNK